MVQVNPNRCQYLIALQYADTSGKMLKHIHVYFNELKEKHKGKFPKDKGLFTFLSIIALK
jgi:predicted nucleic acid-binding Zn finger protein